MAWLRSPVEPGTKSSPDSFLEQTLSSKIIADNLPAIDQLRVLIEVVEHGEKQVRKAAENELLVIVGNTGAGKSTFINYLGGCEMEVIDPDITQAVGVKPGSAVAPLTDIGHSAAISETFMPKVIPSTGFTFVDCPGFNDTRGAAINIGNAVNIKELLRGALHVRVVLLISYYSLKTGRLQALQDLCKSVAKLFGSVGEFVKHAAAGSIAVVISKSPRYHPMSNKGMTRQMVLELLMQAAGEDATPDLRAITKSIKDYAIVYDPMDNGDKSWLKRDDVVQRMHSITPIGQVDVFKVVITDKDRGALLGIITPLQDIIEKELGNAHYASAARVLGHLVRMRRLEDSQVTRLLSRIRSHVTKTVLDKLKKAQEALGAVQQSRGRPWPVTSALPAPALMDMLESQELISLGVVYRDALSAFDARLVDVVNPGDTSLLERLEGDVAALKRGFDEQMVMERRQRFCIMLVLAGAGGFAMRSML